MTVLFCPTCGVSNRAAAEECVECGAYLDARSPDGDGDASGSVVRTRRHVEPLEQAPLTRSGRPSGSASSKQGIAIVSGVVLLVSAGLTWYAVAGPVSTSSTQSSRNTGLIFPKDLKPRLDEFRLAWLRSDIEAIAGFYGADSRFRAEKLPGRLKGQGWQSALPAIGEPELHNSFRGRRGTYAAFVFDGGAIRTAWIHDGQRWVLTHMYLPMP